MNSKNIIGPYWFEDEGGKSVIVNQENYRNIILKFCSSLNRRREVAINQQWFMQVGAIPHAANVTVELLTQKFGNRIISRKRIIRG